MSSLVTIIVPVYNAEQFITRCIESIVKQSYTNFELILINDGSKDNSEDICKKYVDNDKVRLINKRNGGVSSARNEGIKNAKGEYITFVDADDWIDRDYVKLLVEHIGENDISMCGYWQEKEDCLYRVVEPGLNNTVSPLIFWNECVEKNINKNTIEKSRPSGFVWRCLFKKKIIIKNELLFNIEVNYSEDLLFLLQYLSINSFEHINYIRDPLYYYNCDNDNSACHQTVKKGIIQSRTVFIKELIEICKKYFDNSKQYECKINEIRFGIISEIIRNSKNIKGYRNFKDELIQLKKSDIYLEFRFHKLALKSILKMKKEVLMVLLVKINAYGSLYFLYKFQCYSTHKIR